MTTESLGRMLVAECPVCRRLFLGVTGGEMLMHVCADGERGALKNRVVEVYDLGARIESKAP